MSKKVVKTNEMRILDSNKIKYNEYSYPTTDENKLDGISVADYLKKDYNQVFKTLVTVGKSKEYYVFVIPVHENLDLKKASKAAKEKSIEMIHVKDINKITGYIKGGCSPIGMKKSFKTFIHDSAIEEELIVVSAGKIGYQIELNPNDLKDLVQGQFYDLVF